MNIYYYNSNYPEKRCCIDISPDNHYIHTDSVSLVIRLIEKVCKAFIKFRSKLNNEKTLYHYFFIKRKGVIHSFNYTLSGNADWICTFETITPRTNFTRDLTILNDDRDPVPDKCVKRGIKDLCSPHCKGVLALSQASYDLESAFLNKFATAKDREIILSKMHVLHPPQKPLTTHEDIDKRFSSEEDLTFIFIGNDFFRKGGREIIDVMSSLSDSYRFRLILISNLDHDDYATLSSRESMLKYREIIESSDYIEWYDHLDNSEVLKLCLKSHVGLLPTIADTYGYSVLEMQAAGCPVITTDIRSLREINDSDCGWIIHLPQNKYHEAYYKSQEAREHNHRLLSQGLSDIIDDILKGGKTDIVHKAHNSLDRITKNHSPELYAAAIQEYIST